MYTGPGIICIFWWANIWHSSSSGIKVHSQDRGVNLLTDCQEMQHACCMHFKTDTFDDYFRVRNDHCSFQWVINEWYIFIYICTSQKIYVHVYIYIYMFAHMPASCQLPAFESLLLQGLSGSRSNTLVRAKTKWKQLKTTSWKQLKTT